MIVYPVSYLTVLCHYYTTRYSKSINKTFAWLLIFSVFENILVYIYFKLFILYLILIQFSNSCFRSLFFLLIILILHFHRNNNSNQHCQKREFRYFYYAVRWHGIELGKHITDAGDACREEQSRKRWRVKGRFSVV